VYGRVWPSEMGLVWATTCEICSLAGGFYEHWTDLTVAQGVVSGIFIIASQAFVLLLEAAAAIKSRCWDV